jgi:hypothetical protein
MRLDPAVCKAPRGREVPTSRTLAATTPPSFRRIGAEAGGAGGSSTTEGLGAVAGGANPLVGGQCFFLETPRLLQPPRLHFDAAVLKREEQAEVSTAEGLGAITGGANPLVGGQCFFLEMPQNRLGRSVSTSCLPHPLILLARCFLPFCYETLEICADEVLISADEVQFRVENYRFR